MEFELKKGDQKILESIANSNTASRREKLRASILLLANKGISIQGIASELAITAPTVKKWITQYQKEGLSDLKDKSRPGRPIIYTEEIAVGESFVISKSDISKWSSDYTAEEIGYFMYGDSKCYGNQCTVISGKANVSIVVTAVVDPSAEPVVSLGITQMFASMNGDKFRVSPTMKYYVPDNCTVIESGFVYSYATSDPDKLVLDNVGNDSVKKHISGSTESSLIYTMNIGTSYSNRVFNVVAFLTYRDAFGDIQTIYTDVYSGSYSSLS